MTATVPPEKKGDFTPSPYQQAVFDALLNNNCDLQVNAVAGSGKTTTLIQALNRLPQDIVNSTLLAAFNTSIADELKKRAPVGVTVKTNHSIGFSALGSYYTKLLGRNFQPKVDKSGSKYKKLITSFWVENYRKEDEPAGDDEHQMFQLTHFTRVTLTNPRDRDAVTQMALERELELPKPDRMLEALPRILDAGADILLKEKHRGFAHPLVAELIDFDDMIWLPFVLGADPKRFALVLVDEGQDLSAAQLDLILKSRAPGGRLMVVGDPRQAIYGFAGADYKSWQNIKEKTGARELPLSVCYRCPTSVIEVARTIVPEIEAAPGAPKGTVQTIKTEEFSKKVSIKDMVLCRVNAPLISTAFKLIAEGKPAKVRGRDIGKSLERIIDSIEKQLKVIGEAFDFEQFLTYTALYRENHDRLIRKKKDCEAQLASLHDQVDSLEAVYMNVAGSGSTSVDALRQKLETLFTDTENGHILLTSIHRAKGLEAERVFLLRPDKLPHPMATTPSALEQEQNLRYVAVTRALKELYIVQPEGSRISKATEPAAAAESGPTETTQDEPQREESSLVPPDVLPKPHVIEPESLTNWLIERAVELSVIPTSNDDPEDEQFSTGMLLDLHRKFCDHQNKLRAAMLVSIARKGERDRLYKVMAKHREEMRQQLETLKEILATVDK